MRQRLRTHGRARECREFRGIETDRGRLPCGERAGINRARRRDIDQNRIEHPGARALGGLLQRDLDRRAALGIERAEIDQQRIGTRSKIRDLLRRDGHRRDRAGGKQDIRGEGLRDGVGDAMDARGPLAQARDHVRGHCG